MNVERKQWRVRVLALVHTRHMEGGFVDIPPGEYTLIEEKDARYQLLRIAESPALASFWFADLLLFAYMGQLEILGVWP